MIAENERNEGGILRERQEKQQHFSIKYNRNSAPILM